MMSLMIAAIMKMVREGRFSECIALITQREPPLPQVLAFRLRLPFFGWSTFVCLDYLFPHLFKLIFQAGQLSFAWITLFFFPIDILGWSTVVCQITLIPHICQFCHNATLFSSVKRTPKSAKNRGKIACIGQNGPKCCVLYAKKYTSAN